MRSRTCGRRPVKIRGRRSSREAGCDSAGQHRLHRSHRHVRVDAPTRRAVPALEGGASLMDDRPRYMISVAAEIVGMHPQTLRIYEAKGLIRPKRTSGNTRLYSEADLERLRLIQQLTTELGLNLAGVEHVLRLQDELLKMRRRLDRMEQQMRAAISDVHKQYRRDLVPWKPPIDLI